MLGTALAAIPLVVASAADAAIYAPRQALPAQTIQEFLANPSGLLAQFPSGGPQMITRVRDLVASDPATLTPVVELLATANSGQSTAIGTGLGQAALMAVKVDQAYATRIQEAIAGSGVGGRTPPASPAGGGRSSSGPASAQPKIGSAVKTKDQVDGITESGTQPMTSGSEIYTNETVRTGVSGKAELLFADRTNLTVAPVTQVKLDKFIYDPNGGSGSLVIDVPEGAFRFITGVQPAKDYEIRTPFATMGVRGTEFIVVITPTGLQVQVISGQVVITTISGQQVTLGAGNEASVSANGSVQGPTPSTGALVNFADLGPPVTNVTLADALSAFSAVTGNTATGATGGGGGGGGTGGGTGGGGTGGGGGSITGFSITGGGGGGTTPSFTTFVANTPASAVNLSFTASSVASTGTTTTTTTSTTTSGVTQSVSPH